MCKGLQRSSIVRFYGYWEVKNQHSAELWSFGSVTIFEKYAYSNYSFIIKH